jgi:ribosomal-protein-serine acetyltransferase
MLPLRVDTSVELRLLLDGDAERFFDLIMRNRDHLDPWMRWTARVQTLDDARKYLERAGARYEAGEGFHAGLWDGDTLAGGIACHAIDRESHNTEIGYWLGESFTGRGLVTRACRAVITALFELEHLHRIEIRCAADNLPSRAVADRLGFTYEGMLRESEWITSSFRDHALYSLLDREWNLL